MASDGIVDLPRRGLRRRKPDAVTLADRARDARQWELAAQLYRKALDRDPRNPPIWVQYGHALKESGELRDPDKLVQAEIAYHSALSLDPSAADPHLQLGHVLKLQGKTNEAEAAYLRAFALDPSMPDPLQELRGLGWSEAQLSELRGMLGAGPAESTRPASADCDDCPDGPAEFPGQSVEPANAIDYPKDYANWVRLYDTINDDDREAIAMAIHEMTVRPLISVVMPVYNTVETYLRGAIDSVRRQLYPIWELCIADDASTAPHVRHILEYYRAIDPRIKVCYRGENGHISAASNSALALAEGSFVALLDHDDVLPEHALYMVAAALDADPEIDLIYSDEDKIDANGKRYDPYFKSDWNPDLMLSQNMFSHLGVYRRSLIEKLGGFCCGYEGSQDYDLVLRAQSLIDPNRIRHIPHILYHWRAAPGSTAFASETKPYALENARRAIADHLTASGTTADVLASPHPAFNRVRYALPEPAPRVSIVIPTRDRVDLLSECIKSLLHRTDYPDFEILVVDNQSKEPATRAYLGRLSEDSRIRILSYDAPFNFSAINNFAVGRATGSLLCLLNNDIEVISPGWLTEMASHAVRAGVGAVGALLYYPDDRIQHGGILIGCAGVAAHAHFGLPRGDFGYFGRAAVVQNVSAVTAACLVMSKTVFEEVGGLNEKDLAVAYNDVDLCLRLRELGYRIVWTPHAELYHHESASRGADTDPDKVDRFKAEARYMFGRWGHFLDCDPYYHPNLRLDGSFELSFPPRVNKPWRRSRSRQPVPITVSRDRIIAESGLFDVASIPDLFELCHLLPRGSIAVVLHLFDSGLWPEMREAIERILLPFDLFISLVKGSSEHMRSLITVAFPHAYIFDFDDRGRDIGPFLVFLQSGVLFGYDLVCKLHTKRSPHYRDDPHRRYENGDIWRRALIGGVLGSSHLIDQIVSSFRSDPDLGMVVADGNIYRGPEQWASNETLLAELLPRIGISPDVRDRSFPGGSIFWIRPFLLRTLAGVGIHLRDFDPEPLKVDGGLGHAVERMFGLICEDAGMRVVESSRLAQAIQQPSRALSTVHVIANYLPQFHPIPENDEWWGTGFTEWTNVVRAKPLFRGHRQPRLPSNLGFYDLRLPEIRQAQATLARRYGLTGFCYYYYWFNGRRVLERPLDQILASGKPDFPFLICWANEPWTRNWDGLNADILLPQAYGPGWVGRFAHDIAPLLRDRRYFRLDGKPMLLIYRIGHIPGAPTAMRELRTTLLGEGISELHLAAAWVRFAGDADLPRDPGVLGLDAYFEFPPHEIPMEPLRPSPSEIQEGFSGALWDYNRIVTAALAKLDEPVEGRRHRGVMVGWDNTARRGLHANVFHGATPANFRRWLRGTIDRERRQGGERVVFVNAWNEWAEGTYLEPDHDFGCGWLEAVASVAGVEWSKTEEDGAHPGWSGSEDRHFVALPPREREAAM
jgi:lipopolysaccharide biosynthesis protein/GT2 family glycosyltransferase